LTSLCLESSVEKAELDHTHMPRPSLGCAGTDTGMARAAARRKKIRNPIKIFHPEDRVRAGQTIIE
jgi:hypothetical protein